LKSHDAKVTFFVSGLFLFSSPSRGLAGGIDPKSLPLIRRMIDEGHEFGSHTQTHPHNDASVDWARENDARALALAARAGFPYHFGWNVDVRDSTGLPDCNEQPSVPCLSPSKLTDFVLSFGEMNHWSLDGFVILSHLENRYRWGSTPDGLARLITTIRAKGHVFARLSEMFALPAE
jgi:peptidoglycan/xylan/chitin deacetylase (PgdA/CDA1 family)